MSSSPKWELNYSLSPVEMEPENEVIKYLINEQDMDDREYRQTVVHESTTSQTSSRFAQLSEADLEQVLTDSTSKTPIIRLIVTVLSINISFLGG